MTDVKTSDILAEWRESALYWEKHSDTIRTMFAPLTSALIEEAGIIAGHSVLDVAAGPGEPSLTIADMVAPSGSVMCTDAVEEMVAAAKTRARHRGISNLQFRQCTADSLPFADSSFDAVVSRLGAMFFPDPLAAFREMLRVTKSGGALSLAVWDKSELNPFAYVITEVISRYIEAAPADPDEPGAFRFAEGGKLARLLSNAGASGVRERSLMFRMEAPISREEFWEMRSGTSETLRQKLAQLTSEQARRAVLEVQEAVREFFPNEQMSFPAQMIVVTGRKMEGL